MRVGEGCRASGGFCARLFHDQEATGTERYAEAADIVSSPDPERARPDRARPARCQWCDDVPRRLARSHDPGHRPVPPAGGGNTLGRLRARLRQRKVPACLAVRRQPRALLGGPPPLELRHTERRPGPPRNADRRQPRHVSGSSGALELGKRRGCPQQRLLPHCAKRW